MTSAKFTVIIPARYDSQRFPGKLLMKLKGKEILAWVYERACASRAAEVYIATDDERIAELCNSLSAKVIMTSKDHSSGTSRIHEAAEKINCDSEEIIVNVQGDEPLLATENIDRLAEMLDTNLQCDMASLTAPIATEAELNNPNCVKALTDRDGLALYFSRSPVPHSGGKLKESLPSQLWQRHLGIYAYRMSFLSQYTQWEECAYERVEKLEQLRAIYNGAKILLATTKEVPLLSIDTPADLKHLENLIK